MRAAIYVRVSTEEQSDSAAAQEEGARAWCSRNAHEVERVYRDEGVSGAEWSFRPGIAAVRADAALSPRPWDLLVVRDLDRIGRDGIRLPELLSHLHDHETRVVEWSTGQIAQLDTMGRMVASIRAHIAELEREAIAHRTRTALAQKAAKGLVTGGRVYGFRNRRTPEGVVYEVDPDEAMVVREIFERTLRGEGARVVAVALNRRGVPSPRAGGGGTGSWCENTIRGIVRSPRYRGEATWGEIGSRYRGGTRTTIRRDDAIRYEVPAIIDSETWERTQPRGSAKARAAIGLGRRSSIAPKYLLVGHAVCGACGGPISSARTSTGCGRTRRVLTAYTCGHSRSRGTCEARWYRPTERLDAVVIDWLAHEVFDRDTIGRAIEVARARAAVGSAPNPRLAEIEAEEADNARAVSRLTAALEHGADDISSIVDRLRARRASAEALRAERARLSAPTSSLAPEVEAMLMNSADRVRDALLRATDERPELVRNVLAAVLVGRIRVMPGDALLLEGVAAPSRLVWSETGREQPAATKRPQPEPWSPLVASGGEVRIVLHRRAA